MGMIKAKNIIIETRLWAFAAWTTPFVALAIVFFLDLFNLKDLKSLAITVIGTTFVTVSVFWWWWAISKISQFAKMMQETDKRLQTIKQDIGKLKEDL